MDFFDEEAVKKTGFQVQIPIAVDFSLRIVVS